MNAFELALDKLAGHQSRQILAAWSLVENGRISTSEFLTVATNILLTGNGRGYALGVAAARKVIEEQLGIVEVPPATSPQPRHLDADRLRAALVTIIDADKDVLMRLERIATNEPQDAAATGSADVITGSKKVTGWTRTLESDPCQLCTWWWREGRVWQPDHPMPRHVGCVCQQTPVTTKTANYQTEKQAEDRRRERRKA